VHGSSLSDPRTLALMRTLVDESAAPESVRAAEAVIAARIALIDALVEDGWVPPASTTRGRLTDPEVLACDLGAWSRSAEAAIDLTRLRPRDPEPSQHQRS